MVVCGAVKRGSNQSCKWNPQPLPHSPHWIQSSHLHIPSTQVDKKTETKKWELPLKRLNDLHGRSIQEVQHLTNNESYKRNADKIRERKLPKK